MKILYFTATGNSLYIAKSIGGELYSIPKMVKEGTSEFTDKKIGKHLSDIGDEGGHRFSYINKIQMVDNYLPLFDMKKEIKKVPKKKIEKHLEAIISDIAGSKKKMMKASFLAKMAFNYMRGRAGKPFNNKRLKVHVPGEGIE